MPLNNMQYDEIIRSYNRVQLKNKRQQDERIALVYEHLPRIKEINSEISSISLNTTKSLLNLSPDDEETKSKQMKAFHDKISSLRKEKEQLLVDNGFTIDYMDMKYLCPDCKDTGYTSDNKKCHCFRQAEVDILYDQSNIKNILTRENFDNFSFDYFSEEYKDSVTGKTPLENIKSVVDICHQFIKDFLDNSSKKYTNLLFFGETGVGKTFLTNCIAKELLENSQSVIYLSAIKLFELLADAEFNSRDMDARNVAFQIYNCDLLIIDDLGTELSNSFTNSSLFNCLNERLLHNRSTIISTNLIFTKLMERYSERITSRLAKEFTFLKIYGDDLRHNKKVKTRHNL